MAAATKEDLQELREHLGGKMSRVWDKLDEMDKKQDTHLADLNEHRIQDERRFGKIWEAIGRLQVKAGVWGLIAGLIPVGIAAFWWLSRVAV